MCVCVCVFMRVCTGVLKRVNVRGPALCSVESFSSRPYEDSTVGCFLCCLGPAVVFSQGLLGRRGDLSQAEKGTEHKELSSETTHDSFIKSTQFGQSSHFNYSIERNWAPYIT